MLILMVPSSAERVDIIIPIQKKFTTLSAVFLHAAWLDQASAHCPIFLTAASRRSRVRVSVPVWGITLSRPLAIVGLVSHYLTNYLIARTPIFKRLNFNYKTMQLYNHIGY